MFNRASYPKGAIELQLITPMVVVTLLTILTAVLIPGLFGVSPQWMKDVYSYIASVIFSYDLFQLGTFGNGCCNYCFIGSAYSFIAELIPSAQYPKVSTSLILKSLQNYVQCYKQDRDHRETALQNVNSRLFSELYQSNGSAGNVIYANIEQQCYNR